MQGLISASDILGISTEGIGADQRFLDARLDHQFTIEGLMIKDLQTLNPDAPIREAAKILSNGAFHTIPIEADGKSVGIVTSTDLIRNLYDMF